MFNSRAAILGVLGDGEWHAKRVVRRAAGGPNDTTFDMVLHFLGVAESDRGGYLCIPTRETPELASDEEDER